MTSPVRLVLMLVAVFVLVLGGLIAIPTATPKPKFVVGQTYGLLYSCLNQIGCYGEAVTIKEVSDDWLVVLGEDGKLWTVNVANIVAYTPLVLGKQAE